MQLLAEIDQDFACEISHLFNFVSNMENYSLWFPGATRVVSANSLPHACVGKSYKEDIYLNGALSQLTITVKKVAYPFVFITEGELEPVRPQMTMNFRQTKNGHCLFSLKYHTRNPELDKNILEALRKDLQIRVSNAMTNLHAMFGEHVLAMP